MMTDTPILVMILVALIVGCLVADYGFALFLRTVLDVSFGFPKSMRVRFDPARRSQIRWGYLGACRVGGTVTNRLFSATLQEGLAFEMRSTFGRNMMQAVLVPWQHVRLEAVKGAIFGERVYQIQVMSQDGDSLNTVEIGNPPKKWLDDVFANATAKGDVAV